MRALPSCRSSGALSAPAAPTLDDLDAWRAQLDCRFPALQASLPGWIGAALQALDGPGRQAWLETARWLGQIGRGPEPQAAFLAWWPDHARRLPPAQGPASLQALRRAVQALQKSPNGAAIGALLASLPGVARHWPEPQALSHYLDTVLHLAQASSVAIHAQHGGMRPSLALPLLLAQAPRLAAQVPPQGLSRWLQTGLRLHGHHPDRLAEFLNLTTPDSRALLQAERAGTLLQAVSRPLALWLRSLWGQDGPLIGFAATRDDGSSDVCPHLEPDGLRLPDVLHPITAWQAPWASSAASAAVRNPQATGSRCGTDPLSAPDRYRARLLHLAAHCEWSQPQVADNLSPLQRLAVECFEDARVDTLALRRYPGLRPLLLALHPVPPADAADLRHQNGLRVRLARLSRALLDPTMPGLDPLTQAFRQHFHTALFPGPADTATVARLALQWVARSRVPSDQFAHVVFTDTQVDYRDDNRHLWRHIEAGDEEESFPHAAPRLSADEPDHLPPRLYPEWDEAARSFRPDWVSVYDRLQPSGHAADIDTLMERHRALARQLKRQLDALKPQDRVRLRRQEEGTELDLDAALCSLSDWRAGLTPDPRCMTHTRSDGRHIAVLLLIDLSASVNQAVPGCPGDTVLSLSRAAVALLAWAISALGDELAIAGFHSNTRHALHYRHIKGFAEAWDDTPKARLAATEGAWSTRMGAALRHAGQHLSGRRAEKKLLLVLTDGEPADVDVPDPQHLVADAAQAVRELTAQGLYAHCISLDPNADTYVSRIFGPRHTVIDTLAQLPRRLPEVFVSLTR